MRISRLVLSGAAIGAIIGTGQACAECVPKCHTVAAAAQVRVRSRPVCKPVVPMLMLQNG
jgi:hypothetical protein